MTFPFFYDMQDLRLYNARQGQYFFSPNTMRGFNSRAQSKDPYGGCVFVTSESGWRGSDRRYTVRVMTEDGSIETWGDFRGYSRYDAHREAQWLGEQVQKGFLTFKDHKLYVEAR